MDLGKITGQAGFSSLPSKCPLQHQSYNEHNDILLMTTFPSHRFLHFLAGSPLSKPTKGNCHLAPSGNRSLHYCFHLTTHPHHLLISQVTFKENEVSAPDSQRIHHQNMFDFTKEQRKRESRMLSGPFVMTNK